MNKVLFGGSFDPIHNGHILMAELAHLKFDADIIFVPSPISIWKKDSAPIKDKIEMILLSIKDKPYFSIDTFEADSGKKYNYSIDTVEYFVKHNPEDRFFYLIGADQVNEFHRWKDAKRLSNLATIIFFSRKGIKLNYDNIHSFNMIEINGDDNSINSTDIRSLRSLDIKDEVIKYIEEHRLYYFLKIASFIDEKRLKHSIEVANLGYVIAKKHSLYKPERAYIAGLLHDIGKRYPSSGEIMEKYYPEYLSLPSCLHHQFVGEYIARNIFGIEDADILNAIKFHATGRALMGDMDMIIYASDKIEPTRDYDSSELINAMMESSSVAEGFRIVLAANKEYFIEHGTKFDNFLTDECFEAYLK